MTACEGVIAGVGDVRLKPPSPSLERGRLGVISIFAVDAGGGAGEAGRLDGLKNEGVLMAYIVQVPGECMLGFLAVVVTTESWKWGAG